MSERPLDKVAYLYGLGKRAEMLRNGGTVMRGAGRSSVTLAKANGEKTRAGMYYEQYFGETLPNGALDLSQVPERVGNSEFINIRNKRRVMRRWTQWRRTGASLPSGIIFTSTSGGITCARSRWSCMVREITAQRTL